jgi:hypothetical protein
VCLHRRAEADGKIGNSQVEDVMKIGKTKMDIDSDTLGDALIKNERNFRKVEPGSLITLFRSLLHQGTIEFDKPNPFVSPASPLWGCCHDDTDV